MVATKTARRQRERRLRLIQGGERTRRESDSTPESQPLADDADDERTLQPWERMLPFEEWS